MSNDETRWHSQPGRSRLLDFFTNLVKMPRWQRAVMTVAVLLAGAGSVGTVSGYLSGGSSNATTQGATLATSENVTEPAPERSSFQRSSPAMAKAGFGCIAGFILGWLARIFFKTVALITALGLALLAGLAYFKVDTSEVEKKYKSGMSWVSAQGEVLYEKSKSHLPGSTSLLGMFMGFRRKRVK